MPHVRVCFVQYKAVLVFTSEEKFEGWMSLKATLEDSKDFVAVAWKRYIFFCLIFIILKIIVLKDNIFFKELSKSLPTQSHSIRELYLTRIN